MNILFVDDEQLALNKLERLLSSAAPKAEKHGFLRAQEAMDFAEKNAVDIALLDINMRGLDGVTMAKHLQKLYPRINIIFCTGYGEYMPDALRMYCSGYLLKPVTEEDLCKALSHLRYPAAERAKRVELRCFGNFDVLCDGKSVAFGRKKAKELLAYLVDRNGAECTPREIMSALFDEDNLNYYSVLRRELLSTFSSLGLPELIRSSYGALSIDRDAVRCDYFDYLDGKNRAFFGEYMSQYSFAEPTCGLLKQMQEKT